MHPVINPIDIVNKGLKAIKPSAMAFISVAYHTHLTDWGALTTTDGVRVFIAVCIVPMYIKFVAQELLKEWIQTTIEWPEKALAPRPMS